MTRPVNTPRQLFQQVAQALGDLPHADSVALTLFAITWLHASQDDSIPSELGLPLPVKSRAGLVEAGQRLKSLWPPQLSLPLHGKHLELAIHAVSTFDGKKPLYQWGADILAEAGLGTAPITLDPFVADLLIAVAHINGPSKIYLPFETTGQLGARAIKRESTVRIESGCHEWTRLGLTLSRLHEIVVYDTSNATGQNVSEERLETQFDTVIAVIGADRPGAGKKSGASPKASSGSEIIRTVTQLRGLARGRAIFVVPNTLLFSPGAARDFRKQLLEQHLLEMVISLPNGSVHGFTGAASILVLNNAQKPQQALFLKSLGVRLGCQADAIPQTHQLMSLIRERRPGEACAVVAHHDLLVSVDLNLEAGRHANDVSPVDDQSISTSTSMTAHFELIMPRQHRYGLTGTPVKELQSSDLPPFSTVDHVKKISAHDLLAPNADSYFLRPGDVVVCVKGAVGTVGLIARCPEPGENGWICGQSIAVLRMKDRTYSPAALLLYLRSPQGQARLASIVVGTTSPTIQAKGLRALRVPVLTPTQFDMAEEVLEKEVRIEEDIRKLRAQQAAISAFLWR